MRLLSSLQLSFQEWDCNLQQMLMHGRQCGRVGTLQYGVQPRQTNRRAIPHGSIRKASRLTATADGCTAAVQSTGRSDHGSEPLHQSSSACPMLSSLKPIPPSNLTPLQCFIAFLLHGFKYSETLNLAGRPLGRDHFMGVIPVITMGQMGSARECLSYEAQGQVVNQWPPSFAILVGPQSLLITNASNHKRIRQIMSPALALEAVEKYLPQIQTAVTDALEHWVSEAEQGRTVLAGKELKALTVRIIVSVALGHEVTPQELRGLRRDLTTWLSQLFTIAPYDVWPLPFHEAMSARRRLAAFVQKEVDLVRAALNSGDSSMRPTSTLATLLTTRDEEGNRLTDQQVIDNILTFLFAGHDTTSSLLTSLLSDLAQHPEVLSKVREEQSRIIATHGHTITPAALRDMTYTQAVLQETLRSRPPVGGVFRSPTEDVAVAGYQVPKGSQVGVALGHIMQNDPRWPSDSLSPSDPLHPSRYNPDRFLTEQGRAQGAQVPFGIGMHKCLGQYLAQTEAKVFLATLARGYTYTADVNTKWSNMPIPSPKNGLPVFFTRCA